MRGTGIIEAPTPGSPRAARLASAIALSVCLLALALAAAPASAAGFEWQACPIGQGAGQCEIPRGLATAPDTPATEAAGTVGHLYVADQSNKRIDEFTAWGDFVRAWGWDVIAAGPGNSTDGGFEICEGEATCKRGRAGPGAGQFGESAAAQGVTVGSSGEVYVVDPDNARVQKFDPEGHFLAMFGGDVIANGAAGSGILSNGSETITAVTTSAGLFEVGQPIEGTGIEAGTTIASLQPEGKIKLSQPAGPAATGSTTPISSPEGPNNVPTDEVQTVRLGANTTGGTFSLTYTTPKPNPSSATASGIPAAASAAEVQAKLEALANIGAGNVAVSGPAGGPWAVEFTGIYADTDVRQMSADASALNVSGGEKQVLISSANAAEVCEAAPECKRGAEGSTDGQFNWPKGSGSYIATVPGPPERLYVGDTERIQLFDTEGAYVSQIALPGKGYVVSLAASATGRLYAGFSTSVSGALNPSPDVLQLNPPGCTISVASPRALATDPTGDLYVIDGENGFATTLHLRKFATSEPGCAEVPQETPAGFIASTGIATGAACFLTPGQHDVYLSNSTQPPSFIRAFGPVPDSPECPPPPAAPTIAAQFASSVDTTNATLKAQINPHYWTGTAGETDYYLQYATAQCIEEGGWEAPCVTEQPTPPGAKLLSGVVNEAVTTSAVALSGLQPATSYRYRFAAANDSPAPGGPANPVFGAGATPGSEGSYASFTTYPTPGASNADCPNQALRTAASGQLPDCRAYEMVSPVEKNGNDATAVVSLDQSTPDGGAITYSSQLPFGEAEAESAPLPSQYLAERDPDEGWASRPISPPRRSRSLIAPPEAVTSFYGFSPDLCNHWLRQDTELALVEGAPKEAMTLYRHHGLRPGCGEAGYELLTPVAPPDIEYGDPNLYFPQVEGFSADGAVTAIGTNAPLFPDGSLNDNYRLYAVRGEERQLVSVLPDGRPAAGSSGLGGRSGATEGNISHAPLSDDGSRAFWTSEGSLYLRLNPTEEESPHEHGTASGKGDLIGPATGTGKTAFNSTLLKEVTGSGWAVGQQISDSAGRIPAGATILAIEAEEIGGEPTGKLILTLSAKATKTEANDQLTGAASKVIENVVTASGEFKAQQEISGPGIAPGTTIEAVGAGTLTLSEFPTASKTAAALSATSKCEAPELACTIAVSGSVTSGGATFVAANREGTLAYFLAGGTLYEFDANKAIAHEPEPAHVLATGLSSVGSVDEPILGASDDASRIYFGSTSDLSPEPAEPLENPLGQSPVTGQRNLYLYERGAGLSFLATFSGRDFAGALSFVPLTLRPHRKGSRISPDGLHVLFPSRASLTGYDNTDQNSGAPASELFIYDAASGEEGKAQLRCVSCNPSNGRPEGRQVGSINEPLYAAAQIPAWLSQFQPTRALSDDGKRVFFESFDPLLLADTNGVGDVYQWEAPEAGDCKESSPSYTKANGGCLSLISSGRSPEDSHFIDASADGSDVFFDTRSSLLPQDPGLIDIYDARVGGGFPQPTGTAECEGEACQSPPAAPDDPTPASAGFEGAGNVAETPIRPCKKGKVRRKGRCVAKRPHRHHRAHRHPRSKR